MSCRLQCLEFIINDKIQDNDNVGARVSADSQHCSAFGCFIQAPSLIIMSQGLAKCSTSVWHCTQCVGLCILFQTSAAITLKALAVVQAMQGWFGVLVVISEGISTFPMPRETEQQCCLEMGSLSLWQYNWYLWNTCIDGHRVFLWLGGLGVFFALEDLVLSLLSQDPAWVCLLSHLWTSAAAPRLFHIAASPACLSSHSWWRLGSFWPWSPKSPGLVQTTQLAAFLTCSPC